MNETFDLDMNEILEESLELSLKKDADKPVESEALPVEYRPMSPEDIAKNREEIVHLKNRLKNYTDKCRDLFIDMSHVNYVATADDSYLEFKDKNYYKNRLYFKIDPQAPRDPKIILASQQFCKILGVPYTFFTANRPSLRMNIVKTWQAGLSAQESKLQNIVKIRESNDCSIIRAFLPMTKSSVQLHELVDMVLSTLDIPVTLEFVHGDDKDVPILHARFLFDKEYKILDTPVCMGFSMVASELDASPLVIEILLHDKVHKTSYIASYGGDPFFKTDLKGIQANQIRDVFPKVLNRIDSEAQDMITSVGYKNDACKRDGDFSPEIECIALTKAKGFSSAIKRSIYQQISECSGDIQTPWDLARHVGLVAKDLDSLKRLDIERGIGNYLNLMFAKE